jgi:hypothetical protein
MSVPTAIIRIAESQSEIPLHMRTRQGPLFRIHFAHRLTESAQLRSVEPTPRMFALEIGFRRAEIIA